MARLGIDRDFLWEFGALERAIQEKVHADTRARENLMVSWHEIPSRLLSAYCARNG